MNSGLSTAIGFSPRAAIDRQYVDVRDWTTTKPFTRAFGQAEQIRHLADAITAAMQRVPPFDPEFSVVVPELDQPSLVREGL